MFLSCFKTFAFDKDGDVLREKNPLLFSESDHVRSWDVQRLGHNTSSAAKLEKLRKLMSDQCLDAYIVPTADAHGSEYVGCCDKRRAWLTGFTGSAGVAVVTTSTAHLFTDSRYYVQAAQELDDQLWTLERVGLDGVQNWDEFVIQLSKGSMIGIDPSLIDHRSMIPLHRRLQKKGNELLAPVDNLIDLIWADRPPRSTNPVLLLSEEFSGRSTSKKLDELSRIVFKGNSTMETTDEEREPVFLLSSLTSIAWLFNMRGTSIPFNPVFYAFALVYPNKNFTLFCQKATLSEEAIQWVEKSNGRLEDYDSVYNVLSRLDCPVITDGSVNWKIVQCIGEERLTVLSIAPVEGLQAIKNETELQGFRNTYLRDGLAWVRWAAWLEESVCQKKMDISEWVSAEKLTEFRKHGSNFRGLAYDNISATGKNAALPHYAPSRTTSAIINRLTPYLNDSGAQYLDGTIDTTRTVHFGKPTDEQKLAFTRVLQGHIAIDTLIFPEGTTGNLIDVLARRNLWHEGMNYLHGTGHGVGEYLAVHEGPEGISASASQQATPLLPGHVISNEPGYYEEGFFGVRIESVIGVKEVETRRKFGEKRWFGFERFTTVPIQTKMVDTKLLSKHERQWLRDHNRECLRKLEPLLKGKEDKKTLQWLTRQ